ncbi:MAG: T9SS type A sorting domain-containing protein [bacterium]|nr:T9SS type A sorting domain-containing protein [bacterium]
MIRNLTRFRMVVTALTLAAAACGFAQPPDITGIGLSGSRTALDTLVIEGDSVHVICSYVAGPEWTVENVGFQPDSLDQVRLYFYDLFAPAGSPLTGATVPINALVVDTLTSRLTFQLRLSDVVNPAIRSLQIEMAIFARDREGLEFITNPRTSHAAVGSSTPIHQPVDAQHSTYLAFLDAHTFPPVLTEPDSGSTIPRRFDLRYSLPEPAYPRTLTLTFRNIAAGASEAAHVLRLRDLSAGSDKVLHLDAAALMDTSLFDSLGGSPQLTHHGLYRITMSYQDIWRNSFASDTLDSVGLDSRVEAPLLFEPRLGSFTDDSTVRVIYQLGEPPDTVWLTFAEDTAYSAFTGLVHDSLAPHILTLDRSLWRLGVVSFFLDGRNIGSNSPYVEFSNRGPDDRLVSQCIYRVTLSCGDSIGNENASASNGGYLWPVDFTTIPPLLLAPRSGIRFNENLRVVFDIPEAPLPGSVYVYFFALPESLDHGSPHKTYLRNITAGVTTLDLNCTQLSYSPAVDSVVGGGTPEQNNTLVDGTRYILRVFYRDSLGNAETFSNGANNIFDNHTEPAVINTPQEGDTLGRADVLMLYQLPEPAPPTALLAVLERTGGVEDAGSPHTLFLSDRLPGADKTITLRPSALATSTGVDSLQGGGALVSRAIYRLRIQCRDTLLNPWASVSVGNLVYPSGTIIRADGVRLGPSTPVPSGTRIPVFRVALRTEGGESLLLGLRLHVDGALVPSDLVVVQTRLWISADSVLDSQDSQLDRLTTWTGGDIPFDGFASPLSETVTHFIVSFDFSAAADPLHQFNLMVPAPSSINCGTDPVLAAGWPLGAPDVPLPVEITSFITEQEAAFGALRLRWIAQSERDNAGFILLRRSEDDTVFVPAASYTSVPELVGRGTDLTAAEYIYVDRELEPGRRYIYRLATETINFEYTEYDLEAEGIPRLPPADFILGEAYPNPFNQVITIPYTVPFTARVDIVIYDLLGRRVRTLVRAQYAPADRTAQWDSRNDGGLPVPSGVYFCRMEAGGSFEKTRKLLLIR